MRACLPADRGGRRRTAAPTAGADRAWTTPPPPSAPPRGGRGGAAGAQAKHAAAGQPRCQLAGSPRRRASLPPLGQRSEAVAPTTQRGYARAQRDAPLLGGATASVALPVVRWFTDPDRAVEGCRDRVCGGAAALARVSPWLRRMPDPAAQPARMRDPASSHESVVGIGDPTHVEPQR